MKRELSALALLLLAGAAMASELQQKMDACAAVEDDSERLACFDTLASSGDGAIKPAGDDERDADSASASGAGARNARDDSNSRAAAAASPTILSKEDEVFNVRLTRCSQPSSAGRQRFYLDNGEVWQQSNSSRNYLRDCDTDVRIYKDVFGYKMEVPSENRRIRIRPVR